MESYIIGPERNNCQLRLSYPVKLSLIEGKMKTFHNKQSLKEFITTKSVLQKILNRIPHTEEEIRVSQENVR
jgi:hypothetical protein